MIENFVQHHDFTEMEELSKFVAVLQKNALISIETVLRGKTFCHYRVWYFNIAKGDF